MKNFIHVLLFAAMIVLLSSSYAMAVNADSVDVFDVGDLPGTYKGNITKGVSTDGGNTYPFDDNFTVECTLVDPSEQYVLLMVKTEVASDGALNVGTPYTISEENILYIDQKTSEADGSISFDVWPSSVENSVLLLGGSFDQEGLSSPVILGTLYLSGANVSGMIELQGRSIGKLDNATLTLTPSAGDPVTENTDTAGAYIFEGVAFGNYKFTIQKNGYLSYEKTTLTISDDIIYDTVSLKGGDINSDGQVTSSDLSSLLSLYLNSTTNPSDVNGDGQVTSTDLSILLANYLVSRTVEE